MSRENAESSETAGCASEACIVGRICPASSALYEHPTALSPGIADLAACRAFSEFAKEGDVKCCACNGTGHLPLSMAFAGICIRCDGTGREPARTAPQALNSKEGM